MKWINHKILTGSIVFFLTGNPLSTCIAIAGSIFPDAIEGFNFSSPQWKKRHRTYSHWITPYLIILFTCLLFPPYFYPIHLNSLNLSQLSSLLFIAIEKNKILTLPALSILSYILFFFTSGAILHILEDALTGKVPSPVHPKKRTLSFKLFPTGSFQEYCFTLFTSSLLLFVKIFLTN